MQVQIFSIFPSLIQDFLKYGLMAKAIEKDILNVRVWDLRESASDPYGSVDDSPFGGGPGMILKPEPIFESVRKADPPRPLYLLSPSGRKLDQDVFLELSQLSGFSLLCGRYEGVDERVSQNLVDGELSLGDFILQGGEVAAMAILEGIGRLLEGALGNQNSVEEESFAEGLLEYPQYTRPESYEGMEVPEVLRSGNHQAIQRWRKAQALLKTKKLRPDLLKNRGGLSPEEEDLLQLLENPDSKLKE